MQTMLFHTAVLYRILTHQNTCTSARENVVPYRRCR